MLRKKKTRIGGSSITNIHLLIIRKTCRSSIWFVCVICLSIGLISFWICRISFIYIFTWIPLSIKWSSFLLYQSGSYLIVAYCIIVFSPLSYCFNMPNISYVVLRRYLFFCNLYLKSINGSLNNPTLTLSPYGLRGACLKSYWAVSVSRRKLWLFEEQYVCIILPVHILSDQADLLLLLYVLPCCSLWEFPIWQAYLSVQWTVF